MLAFSRNKLVTVTRKEQDILSAHGVLEDDIYGLEIDLDMALSTLEILSVKGKWIRMENSFCPRALPFLQEAVGMRLEGDYPQRLQKEVGRKACRHFADLILECCDAAKEAAFLLKGNEQESSDQEMGVDELFGKAARGPSLQGQPQGPGRGSAPRTHTEEAKGMVIDLHVHSSPASPCSSISLDQIIQEAKAIGLDGICLTDHNHAVSYREAEELRQKYGYLILAGNEITTEQGDILVFGLEQEIKGVIPLKELREKVLKAGGFMIAAHTFRGFLTFGVGYLGLTREKAMQRPLFTLVDAVEVLNSKVSEKENSFAQEVAAGLNLAGTGGSDAHSKGEVGIYATRFPMHIQNESQLLEAFKQGGFTPISFRHTPAKTIIPNRIDRISPLHRKSEVRPRDP